MERRTKLFYFGCVLSKCLAIATILLLGINPMVSGVSIFGCIALIMALGFLVNYLRHKKSGSLVVQPGGTILEYSMQAYGS